MRRRNLLVGAVAQQAAILFHCWVMGTFIWDFIVSGWVTSLLFVLLALAEGRMPTHWSGAVSGLVGLGSVITAVLLSGGVASPYSHLFVGLPFLAAMFSPDSRVPTLVVGLCALGAELLANLLAGKPGAYTLLNTVGFSVFVGMAVFSTRMYRNMLDEQQSAHQERLEALARLTESERRLRQSERERAEVERLVLVGQLAAGVAHEVNNPLAYVKANLNHLLHEGRGVSPQELMDVLAETQQGVLHIQQIITDLRGFSRVGAQQEEGRGCVDEAMSEAMRLASLRLGESGQVLLALEPALPPVRLGQRHIVQVLLNLLLNAVDAVEMARPGGPVRVHVRARRVDTGVHLEIEDNGPGIPPDVLPRLFEPFFTTKPPGQGTGLGLSLCREYVSRVGGSLHAENPPGGGARFVLRLPLADNAPRPA